MSDDSYPFADIIRNHIGQPSNDAERAVLAVVDKCERMRAEAPTGVGMFLANDFEGLLIRELNAGIPLEHVDEYVRIFGN